MAATLSEGLTFIASLIEDLNNDTAVRRHFVALGHIKSEKGSISPSEIEEILKVVCDVASVGCPLVNG